MRQPIALVLVLVLAATGGSALAAPLPFSAVEGPYSSVADYCERLRLIKATCTDEPVAASIPAATGPLRALRFIRVRASDTWRFNRRMLVLETPKGLFVDERLDVAYDQRGIANNSTVTGIELKTLEHDGVRLFITMHGTSPKGDDQALMCLVDHEGAVGCSDPGTR